MHACNAPFPSLPGPWVGERRFAETGGGILRIKVTVVQETTAFGSVAIEIILGEERDV